MYTYKAFVRRVYDGDTITCDIDLGFNMLMKNQKIRLYGINTPEIRGESREKGLIARDALRNKISNKWIIIKTYKDRKGKYGRWLADLYEDENDESINNWLLKEGYAEKY